MAIARTFSKGFLKIGKKNKTELSYENHLELLKRSGEILWYKFEGIKLRLGEGAYFTPDFFVMNKDFNLEVHEVKGFWREAAKVRMRTAAEMYPFRFVAVYSKNMSWTEEEF